MLWMCLLALFSLVYAWFDIRGMLLLTCSACCWISSAYRIC